jgi:pimeloyl-ACP methyl ester carboxylesterase
MAPTAPPIGRILDVGGRRLWLHSAGEGGPATVVLPGAGAVGADYWAIQDRAARRGPSVLYDRSGCGWSDAAPLYRSAGEVVDELRALLGQAGVAPPYVLIGHSLGGLLARRYAQRFPAEIAGLVMLDPAHEDYAAAMPAELTQTRGGWLARLMGGFSGAALGAGVRFAPALLERSAVVRRYQDLYRPMFDAEMADFPARLREALVERHVSLAWLWNGMREARQAQRLYDEVRAGGPMPDVPTIVLCASATDDFRRVVAGGAGEALLAAELTAKRRLYEAFAATMPRGEVRDVDAGHVTMSFRCVDAVDQALADVLAAIPADPVPARSAGQGR